MKGLFYLLVGGTPEDLRLGAGDSALKIHYNPPEKIQDVGLWGIKNEARGVVLPYSISVSVPVPFGFRSIWDLVWVGPRVFWD